MSTIKKKQVCLFKQVFESNITFILIRNKSINCLKKITVYILGMQIM